MISIREAYKLMDEMADYDEKHEVIYVEVALSPESLIKDLPSGRIEDDYDTFTIDEWYDFLGSLESVIEYAGGEIVNISHSKHPGSLSEYFDFYLFDKNGKKLNYLIDLRISDHSATNNAKQVREKNVKKLDPNYDFITVTAHNRSTQFNSYDDVLVYIRNQL